MVVGEDPAGHSAVQLRGGWAHVEGARGVNHGKQATVMRCADILAEDVSTAMWCV